ncbi:hypothetical protein [Kineococcus aurantiacus]|uniref:Uncharacterized protein n=1 Tax=Kineococcus aurantiacus TaxID=37633 RepID=A0A7Y9DLI2_9ACTN|nr:hypothetical protein [Kineococcus aurantiacus]NYD22740.1 hypothetical protein [Kineococcus aurantiacus]
MARQPWWRATSTLEQSKRSGLLYAVVAVASWGVVVSDPSPLAWLAAVAFSAGAVYFLAAWRVRRSREGE